MGFPVQQLKQSVPYFIRRHDLFRPGQTVLVAVSGGPGQGFDDPFDMAALDVLKIAQQLPESPADQFALQSRRQGDKRSFVQQDGPAPADRHARPGLPGRFL